MVYGYSARKTSPGIVTPVPCHLMVAITHAKQGISRFHPLIPYLGRSFHWLSLNYKVPRQLYYGVVVPELQGRLLDGIAMLIFYVFMPNQTTEMNYVCVKSYWFKLLLQIMVLRGMVKLVFVDENCPLFKKRPLNFNHWLTFEIKFYIWNTCMKNK